MGDLLRLFEILIVPGTLSLLAWAGTTLRRVERKTDQFDVKLDVAVAEGRATAREVRGVRKRMHTHGDAIHGLQGARDLHARDIAALQSADADKEHRLSAVEHDHAQFLVQRDDSVKDRAQLNQRVTTLERGRMVRPE